MFPERDIYFGHKCHFVEKVQNNWIGTLGMRIFFMTSGWRKVVQIKEMNF